MHPNPIAGFLEQQGVMILDGGLATTLEARGADLKNDLWSASVVLEDLGSVKQVHLEFLRAGADCIVTSTYQVSFPGLARRGIARAEAENLMRSSVDVAVEARDEFWIARDQTTLRMLPLVAASIGPYGAYLSDGSEYTGDYGVRRSELRSFHQDRWQILADSRADLLACETIPSRPEAEILLDLLKDSTPAWAWMSFTCKDEHHISDGTPIKEVAELCDAVPGVAAIGVNCTSPKFIPSLISEVRSVTQKPVIVYPNSGDVYVPSTKTWSPVGVPTDWSAECVRWAELGASCIGGCCRLGPNEIEAMRRALVT